MANVEISAVNADRKRSSRRRKRRYHRVTTADGTIETLYRLDLTSSDFGSDFALVFQSAVNKARRENKKLIGTTDVEPE